MTAEKLNFIEIDPQAAPIATIIWLHGLGADGHDFEPIVPELKIPDSLPIRFVFPHAPERAVTINFGMVMPAWFDILNIEGPNRFNISDILESSRQLTDLIHSEMTRGMPPERIILAGFSQGGTIALHTGKSVAKTKHGIWNRVVKALVKMRTVSATQPGRALTFTLEQGDVSLVSQVEAAIERVEWATGERVEMVGVDRGALSQEVLEAFAGSDTGLAVWADDTTVLRRAVAAVPRGAFVDGEYETIRRPDGKKVRRLKTRLADVPQMAIDSRGYRCRTVVVEDTRNGHRAAFHVVGKPADRQSAKELLAFLRGKQWAEEDFKQGRPGARTPSAEARSPRSCGGRSPPRRKSKDC